MSGRAIDLALEPAEQRAAGVQIETYTYSPAEVQYSSMAESVKLQLVHACGHTQVRLTPDEARVLANQLLQVADVAEQHAQERQQREADELDEAHERDLENDRARECEERGEEYVPPAIGRAHWDAIEYALEHSLPLRWWQADLVRDDPRLTRCEVIPQQSAVAGGGGMSGQRTPGPILFVIKNAFGAFEVGIEGDGLKRYRVNVAGGAVSAWCEYPIETTRGHRKSVAIGTRHVKANTPLLARLESEARAAIAKAAGSAS